LHYIFFILSGFSNKKNPKRRKMENRKSKLEIGNWKMETGNWKLEIRIPSVDFPFSIFQSPFSSFDFPFSIFACPGFTQRLAYGRFLAMSFDLNDDFCPRKALSIEPRATLTHVFSTKTWVQSL